MVSIKGVCAALSSRVISLFLYCRKHMGWINDDEFQFWVPAKAILVKGDSKDGKDDTGKRWIQGIASTSKRDLQGEIVDQNGIDFTYFLQHGYFNNDHKSGFSNKVGQPTECRVTRNGLWVKGFLFKNHNTADSIWELLHAIDASDSDRSVGFSIQGKVTRREGNSIKECWIQDVAVTPAPINTTTWAEIAKSLSAQKWDFSKAHNCGPSCEDCAEEEKKSHSMLASEASSSSAGPLVPESLEGKKKEDRTVSKGDLLTYNETVSFLQEEHNIPRDTAELVSNAIFDILNESGVKHE